MTSPAVRVCGLKRGMRFTTMFACGVTGWASRANHQVLKCCKRRSDQRGKASEVSRCIVGGGWNLKCCRRKFPRVSWKAGTELRKLQQVVRRYSRRVMEHKIRMPFCQKSKCTSETNFNGCCTCRCFACTAVNKVGRRCSICTPRISEAAKSISPCRRGSPLICRQDRLDAESSSSMHELKHTTNERGLFKKESGCGAVKMQKDHDRGLSDKTLNSDDAVALHLKM